MPQLQFFIDSGPPCVMINWSLYVFFQFISLALISLISWGFTNFRSELSDFTMIILTDIHHQFDSFRFQKSSSKLFLLTELHHFTRFYIETNYCVFCWIKRCVKHFSTPKPLKLWLFCFYFLIGSLPLYYGYSEPQKISIKVMPRSWLSGSKEILIQPLQWNARCPCRPIRNTKSNNCFTDSKDLTNSNWFTFSSLKIVKYPDRKQLIFLSGIFSARSTGTM